MGNIRWGNIRWGNIRWGNIRWGNVRWGNIHWGMALPSRGGLPSRGFVPRGFIPACAGGAFLQALNSECPPRAGLRNPGGRADKHKALSPLKFNPMRPPRFLRTSCPRQKFIMRGLEISKYSKPCQCGVLWVASN